MNLPDVISRNVILQTISELELSQLENNHQEINLQSQQPSEHSESEYVTQLSQTQGSEFVEEENERNESQHTQRDDTQQTEPDEGRDSEEDELGTGNKRRRATENHDIIKKRYLYIIWCYHLPYCKLGFTSDETKINERYATYYGNFSVLWYVLYSKLKTRFTDSHVAFRFNRKLSFK